MPLSHKIVKSTIPPRAPNVAVGSTEYDFMAKPDELKDPENSKNKTEYFF